jgi:hypothetical protein
VRFQPLPHWGCPSNSENLTLKFRICLISIPSFIENQALTSESGGK